MDIADQVTSHAGSERTTQSKAHAQCWSATTAQSQQLDQTSSLIAGQSQGSVPSGAMSPLD